MDTRQERQESRKRGADLRNVEISPLKINNDAPTSKPKILESALIKQEDINLPKFRRSTIISETSYEEDEQQLEEQKPEIDFRDFEDDINDEPDDDDDEYIDKNYTNTRLQEDTGLNHRISRDNEDVDVKDREEQNDMVRANKPSRLSRESSQTPEPTRKRGRPKKSVTTSAIVVKRKRGRPRKGQEMTALFQSNLGQIDASLQLKKRKANTPEYGPPVSLTKSKQFQSQKPLYIDMERLKDSSNKRHKLNTLDVLKYLIKEFEPIISQNDSIKPKIIQKDMKTHLLDHLNHLSDVHGSIDDLNHEISKIHKEKELTRIKIFELRKDHNELGNNLNKLRNDYQQAKEMHEKFLRLTDNIDELRQEINHDAISDNDLIKSIDSKVNNLGKIFNPVNGVNARLKEFNDILTNINKSLT